MFHRLKAFGTAALLYSAALNAAVAIDIGHTPKHYGALSAHGLHEYDHNRRMAEAVLEALQNEGIEAFIINPEGEEISLTSRTKVAKAKEADLFISIHHDSVKERFLSTWAHENKTLRYCDEYSGYALFVSQTNPDNKVSYALAERIGHHLRCGHHHPTHYHAMDIDGERRKLLDPALGIYAFDELAVLRTVEMPAVLIECGFIVSRYDEREIASEKYQQDFAKSIATAVKETLHTPR